MQKSSATNPTSKFQVQSERSEEIKVTLESEPPVEKWTIFDPNINSYQVIHINLDDRQQKWTFVLLNDDRPE